MTQPRVVIELTPLEQRKAIVMINRFAGMYERGDLCRGCKHHANWKRNFYSDCIGCGVYCEGRMAISFTYDQKVKLIDKTKGAATNEKLSEMRESGVGSST